MTAKCSVIPATRPVRGGGVRRDNAAEGEPVSQAHANAVHGQAPNSSQVRETEWLLKALRPFLRVHIGSLVCVLIASLLSLCDPLIIKWLIDVVLPSRQARLLAAAAAGLLASYIGRIGFQSLSSMLIFRTVQKMVFNLRVDLLDHLHRLSASYHENTPVGETLFRLEQDVDKIGELGGDLIPEALRTILVGGLLLVIMFALNWRLACVAAPAVPIFVLLRRYYGRRLKDSADSAQQQSSRVTSFLQEHLSAVSQIQLLCREREEAARFAGKAANAIQAQVERRKNEIRFGLWTLLVIYGGICLVLGYGGYEVMRGALTVGGLVAFYSYSLRLFEPMARAVDIYSRLQRAGASIRRILEVKNEAPTVVEQPRTVALGPGTRGMVSLKNVTFGYRDRCQVLNDLSFTVEPGERVAIVGASGSGKSTIARLIPRQYDPWSGAVTIDGHDVRSLQIKSLRSAVCLVPQDTVLFDATLKENLLYGNPSASRESLVRAAEIAQLWEVISELPMEWDEPLGPRGARLSGGQRQRIAIARAILRDPQVLILDEATSALDSETEQDLLDALETFLYSKTCIVVSHRLSTVRWADRILVIDGGEIGEEGTHAAMLARMGAYRRFWLEVLRKPDQESEQSGSTGSWEEIPAL